MNVFSFIYIQDIFQKRYTKSIYLYIYIYIYILHTCYIHNTFINNFVKESPEFLKGEIIGHFRSKNLFLRKANI